MTIALTENLEKNIKKTTLMTNVLSILITLISTLALTFGFYYKTIATIDLHDKAINEIQKDVLKTKDKVSQIEVFKGVSSSEMKNLEKKVDKIDLKLDKLLLMQKR
tara:strand:- start:176 stop:493 length:318 start_codon:yes stop_codon:yes gene_type:complete